MARKIVLIGTILGLIFVVGNYHFLKPKQAIIEENKTTIFTLDTLASIHAKMILGENGTVTLGNAKKLSEKEKTIIHQSQLIIDTVTPEKSPISSILQSYKGTYLTIPFSSGEEVLHNSKTLKEQIELIRDAIVTKDTSHPGYYYDSAGNYLHLLDTLYESIQNRLNKYHKAGFITLGGDFDNFVERFGLSSYRFRAYSTIRDFTAEKGMREVLKKEKIYHAFVFSPMSDSEVRTLEQKYDITIYRLPQIEEDISGWGYLRYLEKVSDQFVMAFDTYD